MDIKDVVDFLINPDNFKIINNNLLFEYSKYDYMIYEPNNKLLYVYGKFDIGFMLYYELIQEIYERTGVRIKKIE